MGVLHFESAFTPRRGPDAHEPVCARCGAPGLLPKTISMAFWRGSGLYVIRGIPVLCCQTCNDEHMAPETVLALDRMRSRGLSTEHMDEAMIVPVYRFAPPK